MRAEAEGTATPHALERVDHAAAIALAAFFICYAGALIGYVAATWPPLRHDALGRLMPDLRWEGIAYLTVGILLAFLSHVLVFLAFRWRLRRLPLRALLPVQLMVVAGSLLALRIADAVALAMILAPAIATCVVYGVAMLVVHARPTAQSRLAPSRPRSLRSK